MKTFSIREALRTGWNVVKNNLWFAVSTSFIYFIFSINPRSKDGWSIALMLGLIGLVFLLLYIRTIVHMGYLKTYLKLLDGVRPRVREIFAHIHPFWRYVWSVVLFALRVFLGFLLLIVPGIIWAIKFQFMPILTLDKGLGAVDAMRESARMTEGQKWHLFKLGIVIFLLNILGFLCLGVGALITMPLTTLMHLYVYRQLSLEDGQNMAQPQTL